SNTAWNPKGDMGFSPTSGLVHELTHALQRQEGRFDKGKDENKNKWPDIEDEATNMQNKQLDSEDKPKRDGYGDRNPDADKTEGPPPPEEGQPPQCECEIK
ncbi:MAG: hypothetical protein ABI600_12890, partial [Luteolibacter sp.]